MSNQGDQGDQVYYTKKTNEADYKQRCEEYEDRMLGFEQRLCEALHDLKESDLPASVIILTDQDNAPVIALCEGIGVELIPVNSGNRSAWLSHAMLKQLCEEMEKYQEKF